MNKSLFVNKKINSFIDQFEGSRLMNKKVFLFLEAMSKLENDLRLFQLDIQENGYSSKKEKRMFILLDKFFLQAQEINSLIKDRVFINNLKKLFREVMKPYMAQSKFVKRGYLKPKGYPGDFKMLEAMYNNVATSKAVGLLFDNYYLREPYVQTVRNRKDQTREILSGFINSTKKDEISVLNLACGVCREVRELLSGGTRKEVRVNFYLVDQDKETINFAQKNMRRLLFNGSVSFVESDVLTCCKNLMEQKKKFDFVYSIGLADYLPDSILGLLVQKAFNLLKEDGVLFVAHKNVKSFPAPAPDWMCNWKFIPRSKEDLKRLVKNYVKLNYRLSIINQEDNLVFFVVLKKA